MQASVLNMVLKKCYFQMVKILNLDVHNVSQLIVLLLH